ncbi:GGDEF domain-containing protein [Vibrio sinensis]|uniref:GGDEF domain-containing protein n=1 Tax=Vibrio sinensis TaxID=2302434 RepID=A0A3A6QDM7_9VIBR|nr:sensor domain-containing diguanylate cyclase [Vibrio sinensis]RJX70018.1 GGDEF domain-containing protein [Vibrio sinensis]
MTIADHVRKTTLRYTVPFILFILLMNFGYWLAERIKVTKKIANNQVEMVSLHLNTIISDYKNLLYAMSQDSQVFDNQVSLVERSNRLWPYQESFRFALMGISDEFGYSSSTFDSTTFSIGHRDYFKEAITTKKFVISNVLNNAMFEEKIYVMCQPLFNTSGHLTGVIHASIAFSEIQQVLNSAATESVYSVLVDDDFNIIGHPVSDTYIGSNVFDLSEDEFIFNRDEITINSTNIINGYYTFSFTNGFNYLQLEKVEGTHWTLVSKANFNSVIGQNIYFAVLNLLVILVLSLIIYRRVKKSIVTVTGPVDHFLERSKNVLVLESSLINEQFDAMLQASIDGVYCPRSGALNRLYFMRFAEKAQLNQTQMAACIFVDLDNLKTVNDTFGHIAGDEVIVLFANILKETFQHEDDHIGRFGGDEFVVYTHDFNLLEELESKLKRLLKLLRKTIEKNNKRVVFSASIGVAVSTESKTPLATLIHCADIAVYRSKLEGKDRYTIYDPSMEAKHINATGVI